MAFSVKYLLVSAVVLSVFSSAIAAEEAKKKEDIKCYQCNSVDDIKCLDEHPPEKYLLPCNKNGTHWKLGEYQLCRKLIQTQPNYKFEGQDCSVGALFRIIRKCGVHEEPDRLGKCFYRGGFGASATYCSCKGDGCNGSRSLQYSLSFLLTSSIFSFIFLLF